MLERSATADLFKNTLSRIPTVFGRLYYLASLRDPNSGIYRHHGLVSIFGREESRKALSQSHWDIFQTWLNMPLEEKTEDLKGYLNGLDESPSVVVEHWASAELYRSCLPEAVHEGERELFLREFEILLEVLNCPPGTGSANRG
jgi:hypothetical protein